MASPAEIALTAAAVGAAVGLDNMRAALAVSVVTPIAARRRWLVALLAADAAALAVGGAVGAAVPAGIAAAAAIGGVIVLVVLAGLAFRGRDGDEAGTFADLRLVAGVPIVLAFDNLAAGAALVAVGNPPLPTIAVAAGVAGLLCLAGFLAGGVVRSVAGPRVHLVGGVLLSVAALLAAQEVVA